MQPKNQALQRLQGHMLFLASATHGLEAMLGRGAPSVAYASGRKTGLKLQIARKEPDDLLRALTTCREEMDRLGIHWPFEPHKKKSDPLLVTTGADGELVVKLAVHHCMGRASLLCYGHPQKLSMCNMYHGLFSGILDQIYGGRAAVTIRHAGENACYLELTVAKKK